MQNAREPMRVDGEVTRLTAITLHPPLTWPMWAATLDMLVPLLDALDTDRRAEAFSRLGSVAAIQAQLERNWPEPPGTVIGDAQTSRALLDLVATDERYRTER